MTAASPSAPRRPGDGPSLHTLEAEASHAQQRVSLYRRKILLGRGEPREMAELERIALGATGRLKRARREGTAR